MVSFPSATVYNTRTYILFILLIFIFLGKPRTGGWPRQIFILLTNFSHGGIVRHHTRAASFPQSHTPRGRILPLAVLFGCWLRVNGYLGNLNLSRTCSKSNIQSQQTEKLLSVWTVTVCVKLYTQGDMASAQKLSMAYYWNCDDDISAWWFMNI